MIHVLSLALLLAPPGTASTSLTRDGDRPATRKGNANEAQVIAQRLLTRKLTVNWEGRPLEEAATDLSTWLDVPFLVAPALADRTDEAIDLKLTKAPGRTVLRFIQHALDVRFLLDRGHILITTPEDTVRRTAVLRIYDIRALLHVAPDFRAPEIGLRPSGHFEEDDEEETVDGWDESEVVDLLRRGTGESNWEFTGVSIDSLRGRLVVRHTPAIQRKIREILLHLEAR